jgi:hypothetical protein
MHFTAEKISHEPHEHCEPREQDLASLRFCGFISCREVYDATVALRRMLRRRHARRLVTGVEQVFAVAAVFDSVVD